MTNNQAGLDAVLADLRKDYVAALPSRIDGLRKLLHANDFRVMRDEFHKLKGTGKTYGIPEVSELCDICEVICRDKPKHVQTAIPTALELLMAIYVTRSEGKMHVLTGEPAFERLKSF